MSSGVSPTKQEEDHGLVECTMKVRIASKRVPTKPDFVSLKDTSTAEIFDRTIETALSNGHVDPECATERLQRLNNATQEAIKALPAKKLNHFTSALSAVTPRSWSKQGQDFTTRCLQQSGALPVVEYLDHAKMIITATSTKWLATLLLPTALETRARFRD